MIFLVSGCAVKKNNQVAAKTQKAPQIEKKNTVIAAARSNIGVPYRFGGSTPETGFDCSGLVCWTYDQVGIRLPRRASEQVQFGHKVKKEELKPGDIVVFKGTRGRTGWHSGIYTGDNKFVHSPSTGKTVTESSLDEKYFAQRFVGARRIPRDGSAAIMMAEFESRSRAEASAASALRKNKRNSKKTKQASYVASAKNNKKGNSPALVAQSKPGKTADGKSKKKADKSAEPTLQASSASLKGKSVGSISARDAKLRTAAAKSPAKEKARVASAKSVKSQSKQPAAKTRQAKKSS